MAQLVRIASVLAQLGLLALLFAIVGSVFLVLDVVDGLRWAAGLSAALAVLCSALFGRVHDGS